MIRRLSETKAAIGRSEVTMNADEDPNWEAEAEAAEAEERRAESWHRIAAGLQKLKNSQPLEVNKLARGTRLVVSFFEDADDPLATGSLEFTILDPTTSQIQVKDERNLTAVGTLLGCEHFVLQPFRRVFQAGKLEQFWWLNYEADGKKFDRDTIPHTIKAVQLALPSGKTFDVWND
jgi:hypothetical protein